MKTFKGRKYGPYCEISGTEPSLVTLSKTGDDIRLVKNLY